MDRLQSMRVFQAVVDEGGFAAAGRKLDLTPAVVTRLVADLEAHLGVRLLQRTTRRLSLTPAGEAYLARLRPILGDIEEADAAAQAHTNEMRGTVRILAMPVIATHILAPAVAAFQQRHPGIVLDVTVEDLADPPVEDYDVTLVPELVHVHPDVVVRSILRSVSVVCAAPDYLARHGTPQAPEQLPEHRWLRLRAQGQRLKPLVLLNPQEDDRPLTLELPVVVTANHTDTLLRATVAGAGISSQPADLIAPYLRSGELRRLLPPWITNRLGLVAAVPSRKFMPARTRAFLDHFAAHARESMHGLGLAEQEEAAPSAGPLPRPDPLA